MGSSSGGRGGAGGGRGGRPRATATVGGLTFTKSDRATEVGRVLVVVSTTKMGDSLEPGTMSTLVPGRTAAFSRFMEQNPATAIHAPRITMDRSGRVVIEDGRNRFQVLRGIKRKIAVSVPRGQAERIRRELQ